MYVWKINTTSAALTLFFRGFNGASVSNTGCCNKDKQHGIHFGYFLSQRGYTIIMTSLRLAVNYLHILLLQLDKFTATYIFRLSLQLILGVQKL